jgi:hypothetical protein
MRHVGSFFLALLLAPVIWILTGVGAGKFAEARAASANLDADLVIGLVCVLGAGLCYSVLALTRLSPIGPVLVGLAFLGGTGWRVADLTTFQDRLPQKILGVSNALQLPAEGYAAMLAIPLLITMFSPRRWHRYDPAEMAGQPAYSGATASPPYPLPSGTSSPGLVPSPPAPPSYAYNDPATTPAYPMPAYPGGPSQPAGSNQWVGFGAETTQVHPSAPAYPSASPYSPAPGHAVPQSNPETTAPLPTAGYPPPGPGYSLTSPTYPPTGAGYLQAATTPTSPPSTSRSGSSTEDTTWLFPDDPEATHRL